MPESTEADDVGHQGRWKCQSYNEQKSVLPLIPVRRETVSLTSLLYFQKKQQAM